MIQQALALFRLDGAEYELIRHNENMTYKVTAQGKSYLLRIHQPTRGFELIGQPDATERRARIESEMALLAALHAGGDVPVQRPVACGKGSLTAALPDGVCVTLLEWIEGAPLDCVEITPAILRRVGQMTARLHRFFEGYTAPFEGYRYTQAMLPFIMRQIEEGAGAQVFTAPQAQAIEAALDEIRRRFDKLDQTHQKHAVHADLDKSNLLLEPEGNIAPIDFGLCGISHFLMDLGGLFGTFSQDAQRVELLRGYQDERGCAVNPYDIEPYFALQVMLFIACQHRRAGGWDWFGAAMERWCREIFTPLAQHTPFLLSNMSEASCL